MYSQVHISGTDGKEVLVSQQQDYLAQPVEACEHACTHTTTAGRFAERISYRLMHIHKCRFKKLLQATGFNKCMHTFMELWARGNKNKLEVEMPARKKTNNGGKRNGGRSPIIG